MPPILEALAHARRGRYALKTMGEVIEDPDFSFTLTMCKPQLH